MKCEAAVTILASEGLALVSVSRQHARRSFVPISSFVVSFPSLSPSLWILRVKNELVHAYESITIRILCKTYVYLFSNFLQIGCLLQLSLFLPLFYLLSLSHSLTRECALVLSLSLSFSLSLFLSISFRSLALSPSPALFLFLSLVRPPHLSSALSPTLSFAL